MRPLGYRKLPSLNIACSGQSVSGRKEEWLALANDDEKTSHWHGIAFTTYSNKPLNLGSLIEPSNTQSELLAQVTWNSYHFYPSGLTQKACQQR